MRTLIKEYLTRSFLKDTDIRIEIVVLCVREFNEISMCVYVHVKGLQRHCWERVKYESINKRVGITLIVEVDRRTGDKGGITDRASSITG